MRLICKVVVGCACLLLAGAPVLACLLPGEELSPAEKQCCREMAGQCGRVDMPSSHYCCKTVVRAHPVWVSRASVSPVQPLRVVSELVPENLAAANEEGGFALRCLSSHAPPESPSGPLPVLRI